MPIAPRQDLRKFKAWARCAGVTRGRHPQRRLFELCGRGQRPSPSASWGDNALFIEEWFDTGEALQHTARELEIDEPKRWERVLYWVRSLWTTMRFRPA